MATTAPSRKFRTRAIAIAAVGAVALGGLAVVSPTGSVVAAPAAHAQETADNQKVSAADVKFLGLFSDAGATEALPGPYYTKDYANLKFGEGKTPNEGTILENANFYHKWELDISNAKAGDVIRLAPFDTFKKPNGDVVRSTWQGGLRIDTTTEPIPIAVGGTQIGTVQTELRGDIILKIADDFLSVPKGTKVPLIAHGDVLNHGYGVSKDGAEETPIDSTLSTRFKLNNDPYQYVDHSYPLNKLGIRHSEQKSAMKNNAFNNNVQIPRLDAENKTAKVMGLRSDFAAGDDFNALVRPLSANDEGATENTVTWFLEDDKVDVKISFQEFIDGLPKGAVDGTSADPNAHFETSYEEMKKRFPNVEVTVTKENDGYRYVGKNIPDNYRTRVVLTPKVWNEGIGNASYIPGGEIRAVQAWTSESKKDESDWNVTLYRNMPVLPGFEGLEGRTFQRSAETTGSVVGTDKGTTPTNPADIGGVPSKFAFIVKNTGDIPLASPFVTFPDGKKKVINGVQIAPGETNLFTVDYTPTKGNTHTFKVGFDRTTTTPGTHTFYTLDAAQSDSVPDSFGYPQDKPVKVEQDTTVKSPKPNDAPKDTKYRIDRTANPNLPWASVDPNTGVVTLSPKADVVPGNYEVPVEATFPDSSKRTITLPVLVTGENPSDRMKEAEEAAKKAQETANNAQETANQALKDLATERERVNDLTDRVNKAEKDLKDARERVGALEKENDAQQKEIDQAKKDVKDLQDKTKNLRGDLEAAKKRVTALEEQNTKQQGQIDALVKENKKQQGEIDALKKENAKQQKLIDGLRKDLTAAENRISTLETELAQTRLELAAVSERLGIVEDRLNTGLGKCVGTIGGSLAALVPAVLLASQFAGGSHMAQVDASISNFQRQLGMFNPEVAKFVDQNRGAIAAGFAGLGILALLFVPGTCGDDSLGGAIAEPLSSAIDKRKAKRENGEGTTAGSSLKVGDDVGADADADADAGAGSSNKDKEAVAAQ